MVFLMSMLVLLSCAVPDSNAPSEAQPEEAAEEVVISTQGVASEDGALWVRITEPVDGAVVGEDLVTVKGEAPPETVVSIGDSFVYVQDAAFEVEVDLEPGDNLLEIIASDVQGNEVIFYLLVTRE